MLSWRYSHDLGGRVEYRREWRSVGTGNRYTPHGSVLRAHTVVDSLEFIVNVTLAAFMTQCKNSNKWILWRVMAHIIISSGQ